MMRPRPTSFPLLLLMTAAAAVSAIAALGFESEARSALWANGFVIQSVGVLDALIAKRTYGRPLSLIRLLLWLGALPSLLLVVLIVAQGDATYVTSGIRLSHLRDAWAVAFATVSFHVCIVAGALLLASRPREHQAWRSLLEVFGSTFLSFACGLAIVFLAVRVVLVFGIETLPGPVLYSMRLFTGFYVPALFFVGIAARRRHLLGLAVTAALVPVAGLIVLSGSRADALFPLIYLGLGFVAAAPLKRAVAARLGVLAVAVFVVVMFVGDAVRADRRGRTGQAAIERATTLSEVVSTRGGRESFLDATLGRLVSNSTHSVLTRVPSELPHERDGLVRLPQEIVGKFLPRLNISGISDTEQPRNWMLNDLGFLVNWATSVELTLLADAWYRGGWTALLLIGLTVGLLTQLTEEFIYRVSARRREYVAVLIFLVTAAPYIQQHDAVNAFRTTAYTFFAGVSMSWAARFLAARRARTELAAIGRRRRWA